MDRIHIGNVKASTILISVLIAAAGCGDESSASIPRSGVGATAGGSAVSGSLGDTRGGTSSDSARAPSEPGLPVAGPPPMAIPGGAAGAGAGDPFQDLFDALPDVPGLSTASSGSQDRTPSPDNPPECPGVAPADPFGSCVGLPVYVTCEYGSYSCICDWVHWICAG